MNTTDLNKLKRWRQYGGLTDGGWLGEDGEIIHLHEMETNMALALHDLLTILDVGYGDIDAVLGNENIDWINEFLGQEIIPIDEGTRAYRMAEVMFEPEGPLEDYGFLPTALELPDQVWEALEETKDNRFETLGPIILDQNTRTVWLASAVSLEALDPSTRLIHEQQSAAWRAMKEADGEADSTLREE